MKKRDMDVVLNRRQTSIIDSINPDTEKLWKLAKANRQWLQGDTIRTPEGDEVDFSMFDFIVAITTFTKADMSSDLKMLQRFWITLHPYVENLIDHQKYYMSQFQELYGIEGQTLKKFALQNLELQCRQNFMKDASSRMAMGESFDLEAEFDIYHAKFKAESDAEIVKIRAKEEEFVKKQEEVAEKQKKEADQEAFAQTLK